MDHDADVDFCDSNVEQQHESEPRPQIQEAVDDDQEMTNADGERDSDESVVTQGNRHVKAKLTHPSSSRSRSSAVEHPVSDPKDEPEEFGPKKVRVIVKDVAYTTYRAVLYYVRMTVFLSHQ